MTGGNVISFLADSEEILALYLVCAGEFPISYANLSLRPSNYCDPCLQLTHSLPIAKKHANKLFGRYFMMRFELREFHNNEVK